MAEMEKKVRSIRADDEVYAKFKEVCEQAGGQNEALSALISSYELETAKSILSGQATSIDDFKSRIDGVIRAYISALDLSVSAEERVRADYRQRMNTQVKTIEDLQTRNEQLTADYTALSDLSEQAQTAHQTEVTELRAMYDLAQDKATQAEKQREQAEKIANMATEQVEQLKTRVSELTAKANKSDEYKADKERLEASEIACKSRIGELEKKLVEEQEKAAAAMAAATEMAAQDKTSAVKVAVADTKELYQAKIEQMQQAYTAQINALIATINTPKTTPIA
jgi:chromosome segregation ATPase